MAALKLEVPPPPRPIRARRTIGRPRRSVAEDADDKNAKMYCRALEAAVLAAAARNRGMMQEIAVLRAARAAAIPSTTLLGAQRDSGPEAGDDDPGAENADVDAGCFPEGDEHRRSVGDATVNALANAPVEY